MHAYTAYWKLGPRVQPWCAVVWHWNCAAAALSAHCVVGWVSSAQMHQVVPTVAKQAATGPFDPQAAYATTQWTASSCTGNQCTLELRRWKR